MYFSPDHQAVKPWLPARETMRVPCAGPKAGTWESYKVKTAGKEGSPKNSSSLTTTYTQGFELSLSSLGGGGLCYRPLWWSPDPTTQQVTRGRDAVGVFLVIPTYPTSSLSGNLALPQSCHSITAPHSFPAAWGPNPHI